MRQQKAKHKNKIHILNMHKIYILSFQHLSPFQNDFHKFLNLSAIARNKIYNDKNSYQNQRCNRKKVIRKPYV